MPISSELLEILVCPETKQPLEAAATPLVERLNAEIRGGRLRNRGGDAVTKEIAEALVREDGRALYVVDDGIPVMLIEESIELTP
jgi:uncharacterized protein YbaR (Trm112 family)